MARTYSLPPEVPADPYRWVDQFKTAIRKQFGKAAALNRIADEDLMQDAYCTAALLAGLHGPQPRNDEGYGTRFAKEMTRQLAEVNESVIGFLERERAGGDGEELPSIIDQALAPEPSEIAGWREAKLNQDAEAFLDEIRQYNSMADLARGLGMPERTVQARFKRLVEGRREARQGDMFMWEAA